MCRYVARAHTPFKRSVGAITVQASGIDICPGVCHVYISGHRMYRHAVGDAYIFFRAVAYEIFRAHFSHIRVDYGISAF